MIIQLQVRPLSSRGHLIPLEDFNLQTPFCGYDQSACTGVRNSSQVTTQITILYLDILATTCSLAIPQPDILWVL